MDRFLIHNASPSLQADKNKMADKDESTKKKPVNVLDFFGSATVTRSERSTAVKRKQTEVEKVNITNVFFFLFVYMNVSNICNVVSCLD
jgi:hypothetical protein